MARSIQDILTEIQNARIANTNLNGLNSPSQVAIYNLIEYMTAAELNLEEQNWDLFQAELESIISAAPVGTVQWLQQQIFQFQYDSSTPQVVQLVDFVPGYNPVDTTKQIISRCSVITQPNRLVSVKVATGTPPVALNSSQLSSLVGYLDLIGFAGTQYNIQSLNADKLYCKAVVYYSGQYSSVIQTNVNIGINNYLAAIPFNGIIRLSALEQAILGVTGVIDIQLVTVGVRADASSTYDYLVLNNTEIFPNSNLFAGYIVPETIGGSTFNDTIQYIAQ